MTSYKLLRCIRKRIIVRQTTTPKGTYNSSLVAFTTGSTTVNLLPFPGYDHSSILPRNFSTIT